MENDEPAKSRGFGDDLSPPDSYDPFETSRPIPRPTSVGPIEPLLIPRNNDEASRNLTPVVKVPFWDRPKPKKDWYWFLGRLGSSLIILGLLMFLFVGYQLWGTGIEEAQSQNKLEDRFSQIAVTTSAPPPTVVVPSIDEPSLETTVAPPKPIEIPQPIVINEGDPIALIELPTLGVKKYVVAGVQTADLKKGPGHYPATPFPGELGNAAIAGHRTTYGEPFRHLDDLNIGDPIVITDLLGRTFTYLVSNQQVVEATDSWVVATTDPTKAILTLTTCHPEFSAKQRLIISAELDLAQSDIAASPAAMYADEIVDTTTVPSTEVVTSEAPTIAVPETTTAPTATTSTTIPAIIVDDSNISESADALSRGWFSDPSAIPQTWLWAFVELLIVMGAWRVAKKFRNRIIGAAVGFIPFFVVLYFVFQNVNRLLPPNL